MASLIEECVKQKVELDPPANIKVAEVIWVVSVWSGGTWCPRVLNDLWCREEGVDFGHAFFREGVDAENYSGPANHGVAVSGNVLSFALFL